METDPGFDGVVDEFSDTDQSTAYTCDSDGTDLELDERTYSVRDVKDVRDTRIDETKKQQSSTADGLQWAQSEKSKTLRETAKEVKEVETVFAKVGENDKSEIKGIVDEITKLLRSNNLDSELPGFSDEHSGIEHSASEKDLLAEGSMASNREQSPPSQGQPEHFNEFYDATADMEDEAFIEEYLRATGNVAEESHSTSGKQHAAAKSTNVQLCCPNCFMILCLDCQQHETQLNVFRAVFIFNCQPSKTCDYTDGTQKLRSVQCQTCSTVVGVMDEEEVVEFFHVLPSTMK